MHDHLLDDIIQLEKSLQRQTENEKARIQSWLEQERTSLESLPQEPEEVQAETFADIIDQARNAAEHEAAVHRDIVAIRCGRLAGMSTDWLTELLRRHLQGLLPEDGNDCQDGES